MLYDNLWTACVNLRDTEYECHVAFRSHTLNSLLSTAALCGWIFTEPKKSSRYRIWCNKMDIKEVSWSWQKRRKMPSSHQMVAKSLHTIIYDFRNSLLLHKCHSKRLKSRRCCYFLVFHRIMDIAVVVYSVCIKTILKMLSRMYISWLCHSHDIIVNASTSLAFHLNGKFVCDILFKSVSWRNIQFSFPSVLHPLSHIFQIFEPFFSRFCLINLHQLLHSEFNLRKKRVHLSSKKKKYSNLTACVSIVQ